MPEPASGVESHVPAKRAATAALVVSSLGYFVDIYDLILFSIVRMKSLRAIGVPESKLLDEGIRLINWQMSGMLLGGILWGVLGDKRGRPSGLFRSIGLLSLPHIPNAHLNARSTVPVDAFPA